MADPIEAASLTFAKVAADRERGGVQVVTAFLNVERSCANQTVGANIMGLGGARIEAIEFENGRIRNARFSRYRVPPFRDMPQIKSRAARSPG
jgi:CO/xanthine dehydrogenase Mo-binding subunit